MCYLDFIKIKKKGYTAANNKLYRVADGQSKQVVLRVSEVLSRMSFEASVDSEVEESIDEESMNDDINSIRSQLVLNKDVSNRKMIEKHDRKRNKKTVDFELGQLVTVQIPRIDRGNCDFRRLPAMICAVSGRIDQFFKLLTLFGILSDSYRADDLEPYYGIVNVQIENYESRYKKISLREAADSYVNRGETVEIVTSCNCNGVCTDDNRCKCHKAKVR